MKVMGSFGGSAAAKALYHYRTGDVLDSSTLLHLKLLADRAKFGSGARSSPSDRLLDDMSRQAAAGDLNYMAIFAEAGDMQPRIGSVSSRYRFSTEFIDGQTITKNKHDLGSSVVHPMHIPVVSST